MTSITQVIITLGVVTFIMVTIVGDGVQYNLTAKQQQETAILPLCISNNTVGVEGVDEMCNMIYGGPNTTYGDKLK